MSGLIHSLPAETRASAKVPIKRDTSETCRERASADLLKSVTMMTANERRTLESSAAIWNLRAVLLDQVEATALKRAASAAESRA